MKRDATSAYLHVTLIPLHCAEHASERLNTARVNASKRLCMLLMSMTNSRGDLKV